MPRNSCSCRCVAVCDTSSPRLSITGVDLDEKTGVVKFSHETVGGSVSDYIPLHSVKEKRLSPGQVKELVKLLSLNWALRTVADKSQITVVQENYTGRTFYQITGPRERWKCHVPGPGSGGHHFTEKWRRIEEIILGV